MFICPQGSDPRTGRHRPRKGSGHRTKRGLRSMLTSIHREYGRGLIRDSKGAEWRRLGCQEREGGSRVSRKLREEYPA